MAAGAAIGAGPRPVTSSTTLKHSTSPTTNADITSSRRIVRGFMVTLGLSETRRNPGRDDFEEHRGAVVRPQDERRGDQQAGDDADQQKRTRQKRRIERGLRHCWLLPATR